MLPPLRGGGSRLLAGSGGASNSRFAPQALSAAGVDKHPLPPPKAAGGSAQSSTHKSGTETQSHVDEKTHAGTCKEWR